MLEDVGLIPAVLSIGSIKDVLKGMSPSLAESFPSGEATFSQFVELIGSLCLFKNPDPFVPMSVKVSALLMTMIGKMKARHKSTTIVLSDQVPAV
jgi:hypothetical protein